MISFDLFNYVGDVEEIHYDDKKRVFILICTGNCKLSIQYDKKSDYLKLKEFFNSIYEKIEKEKKGKW